MPKRHKKSQPADNDKKQGKKALTETIQEKLVQKREQRRDEKYKESVRAKTKAKPKNDAASRQPTQAAASEKKDSPKKVEHKPAVPKVIIDRPKIKTDYIEHYLQHLFAIKHDIQQFEKETAELKSPADDKVLNQKLTLTHFSLLYNITRCFQALKRYKEITGFDSSQTAPQAQLEDMRNMILKRGILEADPVFTLETGKALVDILSDDLMKMRKPYLIESPFNDKQKEEIYSKLGIVTGEACKRYLLEPFPIPISDTPLFQQLKQFHDKLTTTEISSEKRIQDIMDCLTKIKNYFEPIKEKYPAAPLDPEDTEIFLTIFRKEINALKLLFAACGSLYGDDHLWENIQPEELKQFLKSCRKLLNKIGHHFSNDISCDCPLNDLYELVKLANCERPTMKVAQTKTTPSKPIQAVNLPNQEIKKASSLEKKGTPHTAEIAPSYLSLLSNSPKNQFDKHSERVKPLSDILIKNLKRSSWWDSELFEQYQDEYIHLFQSVDEELRSQYFLAMVNHICTWKYSHDIDNRIFFVMPDIYNSFSQPFKRKLHDALLTKLTTGVPKGNTNLFLLYLSINCLPHFPQTEMIINSVLEYIRNKQNKVNLTSDFVFLIRDFSKNLSSIRIKEDTINILIGQLKTLISIFDKNYYRSALEESLLNLQVCRGLDFISLYDFSLENKFEKTPMILSWFLKRFFKEPDINSSLKKLLLTIENSRKYDEKYNNLLQEILPHLELDQWKVIYEWAINGDRHIHLQLDLLHELLSTHPDAIFIDYQKVYDKANKCSHLESGTKLKELASETFPPLPIFQKLTSNLSDKERTSILENIISECNETFDLRGYLPNISNLNPFLNAKLPISVDKFYLSILKGLILKILNHEDVRIVRNSQRIILFKLLNYLISRSDPASLVKTAEFILDIITHPRKSSSEDEIPLLETLAASLPKNEFELKLKDNVVHAICTSDKLAARIIERYPTIVEYHNGIPQPGLLIDILPHVSLDSARVIFNFLFNDEHNKKCMWVGLTSVITPFKTMFLAMHKAKNYPDVEFRTLFNSKLTLKTNDLRPSKMISKNKELIELMPFISLEEILRCLRSLDVKKQFATLRCVKELFVALLSYCDFKTSENFVMGWKQEIEQQLKNPGMVNDIFSATIFLTMVSEQLDKNYKKENTASFAESKSAPTNQESTPQPLELANHLSGTPKPSPSPSNGSSAPPAANEIKSSGIVFEENRRKDMQFQWNCFDAAVHLDSFFEIKNQTGANLAEQVRTELVNRILKTMESKEEAVITKLLAPEIRHAAGLSAAYLNSKESVHQQSEKRNAEILQLFGVFQCLNEPLEAMEVFKRVNTLFEDNQMAEFDLQAFSSQVLPKPMLTTELQGLVNHYYLAHEQMKPYIEICKTVIRGIQGKSMSMEEVESFFRENKEEKYNALREFYFKEREAKFAPAEKALNDYCLRPDICKQYLKEYYGKKGWIAFQQHFAGERIPTSMIDVIAKTIGAQIVIYKKENSVRTKIYETAKYGAEHHDVQFEGNSHFIALIPKKEAHAQPSGLNISPTMFGKIGVVLKDSTNPGTNRRRRLSF